MPLSTTASLSTLQAQALAFVRSRFPGKATGLANFLGKLANVMAMSLFGLQRSVEAIDRDSPPSAKSSTLGLDTWASILGLPSNVGGYGRNQATTSAGGQALVTGTGGTLVSAGQQLTAPDGVTIIELTGNVTITAAGNFAAVTAGTAGNLPIGTVLTWISPPAGCDATVTLTTALSGAQDQETDSQLLTRIYQRLQIPPKGGSSADYKTWAESIEGVYKAFVYPRRAGTGTVDVVITSAGSGSGRVPAASVQTAVQTYIDSIRPVDVETCRVLLPSQPTGDKLHVHVRATLSNAYNSGKWDWDDTTGGPWTISSFVEAGSSSTITVNTAVPQSLIDAVTAYQAGTASAPRIQIISTTDVSDPVVPLQRQVKSLSNGNKTLHTDAELDVAITLGVDFIQAGSYAAPLAAQNILNYIDSLGPSRASGLADPTNVWEDTVAIARIGQAALDTVDTDGSTRLLSNLLSGGVTMAVGGGSYTATDYQTVDTGSSPPELARAVIVYVTQ